MMYCTEYTFWQKMWCNFKLIKQKVSWGFICDFSNPKWFGFLRANNILVK